MKRLTALGLAILLASPIHAQNINFGDDSSEYANDGDCDDRRFFGAGMADGLDWAETARDASDCKAAFAAGQIQLWNMSAAQAATQCSGIDFGNDSSEWAEDGECDDPRFEGMAAASILLRSDQGHDATDCQRACDLGIVFIRNY